MAKAKKLTKKGRPAKRAARNVRNRASSVAKAEAAGRMGGPSIPLRDLIRGGMPRSPKARGGISAGGGPQVRRRMTTAHGMAAASGASMMQYQPGPLEHVGTQRAPIRKG